MSFTWPAICARCGTTENLRGETVSIRRQKQEKVGAKNYRTFDVALDGHIYLCSECESIAKQEFEKLVPARSLMSKILLALALVTSIVSVPLMSVYMVLVPNIVGVLGLTFLLPGVFWTLVFANSGAKQNFELAGYRRFYFDWTLNGPIRFTNPQLKEAFDRENQYSTRLVDKVSRRSIETPDSGDCCAGMCLGLIIVFALFFIWAVMSGVYDPFA